MEDGSTTGGRAPSHGKLYALIVVMVFLWSANFIVAKYALREFPPLLAGGLRVALAGFFMLPVYAWQSQRTAKHPHRRDIPILFLLGLLGIALNQMLFMVGLSQTSVGHSAIVVAVNPMIIFLMAAWMGLERLTTRKLAGLVIAIVGVAVLQWKPAAHTGSGAAPSLAGDLLILASGLSFAAFTVYGKRVTLRHSSITVNTFGYVGAALAMAPVTWWLSREFSYSAVTPTAWLAVVYMALFPSVICYMIFYYALQHVNASRVAAFTYMQPIIAITLAAILLGERVSASLVAGGVIIFSGVYLAERT